MKERTRKTFYATGFTLVELLVVISIIGMLMGLLLPAVNAARESGRQATCMNNQRNLALALINAESNKGAYPSLRKFQALDQQERQLSWVAQILPNIELANLANRIQDGDPNLATEGIPMVQVLKCPNSTKNFASGSQTGFTSYVVNAGPQNLLGGTAYDVDTNIRYEPGDKGQGLFFDYLGKISKDSPAFCNTTVSQDYISSADGTSYTLLLSENEDAGQSAPNANYSNGWITVGLNNDKLVATSGSEEALGFAFPWNVGYPQNYKNTNGTTDANTIGAFLAACDVTNVASDAKYNSLKINACKDGLATQSDKTPLGAYRYSRPSSGHPSLVIAAYCDGTVRKINNDVDHAIYTHAMMPKSGDSRPIP